MLIDCDRCAMRDIACADCVVTMILGSPSAIEADDGRRGGDFVDLDDAERAAVDALAAGGLISPLRMIPIVRDGESLRGIRYIA
jgi:hypothetical protein